ncbi:MAG TPA: DMT family transporter [Terriglobia bacterium]|nr:DMT family transporter [Terriglobia bacterium]
MENSRDERTPQSTESQRLLWKTTIVCVIVVGTNVIGNYALARGLRHIGGIESWSPVPYIEAFVHFWIAVGVILMVIWLIARLLLLSWADLSYVLLVTSFSYVLTAVAGAVGLHEVVSWVHWLGICLITLGVALVARTSPHTTDHLEYEK